MYDKQKEQGLDIDVFVPVAKGFEINRNLGDYTIISENHKKYDRYIFHLKQKKILKDIQFKYDVTNYSILHAHSLFTNGYIAFKLFKKYRTPYVVAVRNTDVNLFFKKMIHLRKLGIKILKHAHKIIFISPPYKEKVLSQFIPKSLKDEIENKTHIIPNGVDDFWLKNKNNPKTKSENDIKILHVGDVNNNKNVLSTAKAVEKLIDNGYECEFTVVGKVMDHNVYKNLIKHRFIKYLPPVSRKIELLEIYRANDILVVPSFKETFGIVYPEAMSQGLPVIYSKGQGFDGHFSDGEVGKKVTSNDEKEIASKIKDILSVYKQISETCLVNSERFKWKTISNEYNKIYDEVIK
ncbi:glycosyltransferase family 4 protein [Piscibacillus salipiscarius]|uniref:Glycosyltransferase family 4 protein n=2 Tax=Piscibacillus salipiscarius TaxID=299480 RepID=A0ABW5QB99_9BACI